MKLFINKNEKYEEPEVHMFFHKQTKEVEQVEKFVRSLSITIPAKYEDEIYKLYPTDIYYIETIDRHMLCERLAGKTRTLLKINGQLKMTLSVL